MKRKVFELESSAISFASKVNGTVRRRCLPGYMSVEIIWIVEWEG